MAPYQFIMVGGKAIQVVHLSESDDEPDPTSPPVPSKPSQSQSTRTPRPYAIVNPKLEQVARSASDSLNLSQPPQPSADSDSESDIQEITSQAFTFRTSREQIARQHRKSMGNTNSAVKAHAGRNASPSNVSATAPISQAQLGSKQELIPQTSAPLGSDHVKPATPQYHSQSPATHVKSSSAPRPTTTPGGISTARRTGSSRPVYRPSAKPTSNPSHVNGKHASPLQSAVSAVPQPTPDGPSLASLLAKASPTNGVNHRTIPQPGQDEGSAGKRKALDSGRQSAGLDITKRLKTQPLQEAANSQPKPEPRSLPKSTGGAGLVMKPPPSMDAHSNAKSPSVHANSTAKTKPTIALARDIPPKQPELRLKAPGVGILSTLTNLFGSRDKVATWRQPFASLTQSTTPVPPPVVESIEDVPMHEASGDDDYEASNREDDVDSEVEHQTDNNMSEDVEAEVEAGGTDFKPRPFTVKGTPFTKEDDILIIYLKEMKEMQWSQVEKYFPGRHWTHLQSRYSKQFSKTAAQRRGIGDIGFSAYTQAVMAYLPANRSRGRLRKSEMFEEKPMETAETESGTDAPTLQRRLTRRSGFVRQPSVDSQEATPQKATMQDELRQVLRQLRQPVSMHSSGRLLRDRELGPTGSRGHTRMLHSSLRDYGYSTLGPDRYLDNASGDVSTVAWSPNGRHFAAGCVAVTDPESMQYNKPRNLLIGDAVSGHARELPHHRIPRPHVDRGANSTEAMRASQSSDLYTTVQSVAFSADGRRMFSVSIDNHLNVYKVSRSGFKTKLTGRSEHVGPVDLLSVSSSGLVATGCRHSGPGSIQVFHQDDDPTGFSASKLSPTMQKYPSALRFGVARPEYLLAGFSCEAVRRYEEDDVLDTRGETCLWDMNTGDLIELGTENRSVFDLCWNPNPSSSSSWFAVASGATGKVNKGMHSVVRLFNPTQYRLQAGIELECPAWDINDVIYSPHDTNIIAAGSTDGKVFVWDIRQVKNDQGPLRILEHGESLSALPHEKRRWEADTGIRFLSWATDHSRLYSGSSDGVVKCWDPYRSDEDKHVRDVVIFKSAIMSGSFSPDCESLLIGEDLSRLNLLKIGNEDKTVADMDKFTIHEDESTIQAPPSPTELFLPARDLLDSGEIEFRPIGALPIRQAVQGPNYTGPHRSDADALTLRKQSSRFQESAALQHDERKLEYGGRGCSPCTLGCAHFPAPNIQDEIDNADVAGRFLERIPHALRVGETPTGLKAQLLGLVAKCETCGAAARPADEIEKATTATAGAERATRVLCERCGFKCSRCSSAARLSSRMRVVECLTCGLAWRIGVLGYQLIREGADVVAKKETVKLEQEVWDLQDQEVEDEVEDKDKVGFAGRGRWEDEYPHDEDVNLIHEDVEYLESVSENRKRFRKRFEGGE